MEAAMLVVGIVILSHTAIEIAKIVWPIKSDINRLEAKIDALEAKFKNVDPDRIESMLGELKAIKLSTPSKKGW
jgi:hypothetical protein